jgi:uncharacterized UPF0160 family protein
MKKKIDLTGRKNYLFFVLLIFIVLNLFASTKVKAEEKLSRLSFDHISITNITKEQKDNLIKDKPSGIAKMDNERFILVYQPQKEGSYNSNSKIETNTPLGINSSFSKDVHGTLGVGSSSTHGKIYPQTNSKKNRVLSVVGLGIVLFVIVLIKKQYRKSKIFMLFIGVGLISSMFGNGIKGHAEVNDFLIPTVNQTVSKGTNINYDVPRIKGYEYVGYLKTNESITPPTPETGKVTVSYVDESGLDLTTPLTLTGDVGSEYSTEKKTFDGYEFVEVIGDTAGTFSQTEQKIVYHYKKNVIPEKGKVTVSYVDESGLDLTTPLTLTGDVGSEYSTEKKTFDGYEFVEVIGDTAGTFSQTEQKIVYHYKKNVIPEKGKVTVSYVDESGLDLTTPLTLTGDVGSEYSTEKKTFDGYEFVEVIGDTAGTFSQTEQKIVYHYKKNVIPEKGKVTVSYVDESGLDLTTPLTLTGDVGSEYSTEKKTFDGYEFVEVIGDTAGTFSQTEQKIVYHYKKNVIPEKGKVTVSYVDESGLDLTTPLTLTGDVGSKYQTEEKKFEGYRLKKISGNTEGFFSEVEQTIIYEYKKSEGDILFNLKVKSPIANSQAFSIPEYIKQSFSDVSTIDSIQFVKFDNTGNNEGGIKDLTGPSFSTLLEGNSLEFTGDIGSDFSSTIDTNKDSIYALMNYEIYTGNYILGVEFDYTDISGNKKKDTLIGFSLETTPNNIDELKYSDDIQDVTLILTVGLPN